MASDCACPEPIEDVAHPDINKANAKEEKIRNVLSFLIFGGISHGQSAVLSSAVQDVLAGTLLPTTTLQLAKSVPRVIVTVFYPSYIAFIPPVLRVLMTVVATATGLLLVVFTREAQLKLVGVGLFSAGFGAGDVALTGLAAFYQPITMAAYQTGNGFFSLLGPLVYVGMTTWLHCSPGTALMVTAAASSLNLIFYFVMDRSVLGNFDLATECASCRKLDYSLVSSDDEEDESKERKNDIARLQPSNHEDTEKKPLKGKYHAIVSVLPYLLFLFAEYLLADSIINSVLTTLAFPNAPFSPRDHFVYYYLTAVSALFISRSYLTIVMWLYPALSTKIVIERILIFYTLILSLAFCFILLFCATWFRFLNNVGYVFPIILVVGGLSGIIDSNALCTIKTRADPGNKLFVLGQASLGIALGHMISGIVGLFLEPFLRAHCFEVSVNTTYCYTRPVQERI